MDFSIFKDKKILVAEDDIVNQEMMKDILTNMGCIIEIAKDGVEAVSKFQEKSFDLILMDIRMPNKDGMQAIQEIRASDKGKNIPILTLTASISDTEKQKMQSLGANDFVSKPIILEDLRTKMANCLTK